MLQLTPEGELPEGVGFALFGGAHLSMLAVLAALSICVVWFGIRTTEKHREGLLRAMAVSMVVLELLKDFLLGLIGAFSVGYLPLHFCSLAMFVCLFSAWHPRSDVGGQLTYIVCFTGGLSALLFPDWTDFPILHFQSLHSFLYHAMLVQFAWIAVGSGRARPRIRALWKVWAVLLPVGAAVYGLDRLLRTNYMFLLGPVPGTPLQWLSRIPGRFGYLVGLIGAAAALFVGLELPFSLWQWCRKMTKKPE